MAGPEPGLRGAGYAFAITTGRSPLIDEEGVTRQRLALIEVLQDQMVEASKKLGTC